MTAIEVSGVQLKMMISSEMSNIMIEKGVTGESLAVQIKTVREISILNQKVRV